ERRASSSSSLLSSIHPRLLSAVESSSHAPNDCAGELVSGFDSLEHSFRLSHCGAGINGHEAMLRARVCVKEGFNVGTSGGENFVVGEERLGFKTLGFRNEDFAVLSSLTKDRKSTRLNSSHDQISY